MHFKVYDIFYSLIYHKYVSAAIAAIFSVILLQQYEVANVVSCDDVVYWLEQAVGDV